MLTRPGEVKRCQARKNFHHWLSVYDKRKNTPGEETPPEPEPAELPQQGAVDSKKGAKQ